MSHHNGPSKMHYRTPGHLLDLVRLVFGGPIGLDPATSPDNPTAATAFFTERDDGLAQEWNAETVFLNPPWGDETPTKMEWWAARCWVFGQDHPDRHLILLCQASVSSHWWHRFVWPAAAHCFPRGRVAYALDGEEQDSPTFDSALSYYGPDPFVFKRVFCKVGYCP